MILIEVSRSDEKLRSFYQGGYHPIYRYHSPLDTDFIYSVRNHPEIRKNLVNEKEILYGDHIKWYVDSYVNNFDFFIYKIVLLNNGHKQVGYCDIKYDREKKTVELGFKILPDYQGMGYGKECVALLINRLEDDAKKNYMIFLTVFEDNIFAIKLYKKYGFNEYCSELIIRTDGSRKKLLYMSLNEKEHPNG